MNFSGVRLCYVGVLAVAKGVASENLFCVSYDGVKEAINHAEALAHL